MKLISHRGNINGSIESMENNPDYIDESISFGYDVEIDVWFLNQKLWLGHDVATYEIDYEWFLQRCDKIWIHCKNIEALIYFKESKGDFNYFWHQSDDHTITSKGFFWTYPGKKLTQYSIACMPEIKEFEDMKICFGVCSDEIKKYKKIR